MDSLLRRLIVVAGLFLMALVAAFLAIWAAYDFRYAAAETASGMATFPMIRLSIARRRLKQNSSAGMVSYHRKNAANFTPASLRSPKRGR